MENQFGSFNGWRQTGKVSGPIAAIFQVEAFHVEDRGPGVNYGPDERPYSLESLKYILADPKAQWSDSDRALLQQAVDAYPGAEGPGGAD